jgi:hypothetical protein
MPESQMFDAGHLCSNHPIIIMIQLFYFGLLSIKPLYKHHHFIYNQGVLLYCLGIQYEPKNNGERIIRRRQIILYIAAIKIKEDIEGITE